MIDLTQNVFPLHDIEGSSAYDTDSHDSRKPYKPSMKALT